MSHGKVVAAIVAAYVAVMVAFMVKGLLRGGPFMGKQEQIRYLRGREWMP
jgi:hypothetical protein